VRSLSLATPFNPGFSVPFVNTAITLAAVVYSIASAVSMLVATPAQVTYKSAQCPPGD